MLPSAAIQKLERYGQLGLKRSDLLGFVQSSLKDERQSNAYALTHQPTWTQARQSIDSDGMSMLTRGSIRPIVATEMLVYAAGFAVALLQAKYSPFLRGGATLSPCIHDMNDGDVSELILTIGEVITKLNGNNVAMSADFADACIQLMSITSTFVLLLEGFATPSKTAVVPRSAKHDDLVKGLKALLFVACSKYRASTSKTGAFSTKTASTLIKNNKGRVEPHAVLFHAPLVIRLALVENFLNSSSSESSADRALADIIARCIGPSVANRATRYAVYYRGEEYKLLQAEVQNAAEYCVHSFSVTPPLAEAGSTTPLTAPESSGALLTIWWLQAIPCLFKAFLTDAQWTNMAREQRRVKLQREAERRRDERRGRAKQGDAVASKPATRATGSSASVADGDEVMSLLDTVGEETRSTLSTLSQASAASFLSFLSVIDAAQVEHEERKLHESADGNTNLALIYLDQLVSAIQQLVESLPEGVMQSSNIADIAWRQVERMFQMIQASITTSGTVVSSSSAAPALTPIEARVMSLDSIATAQLDLQRTPIFQFSHDMRYNEGLGYQTLGVLFAKVMSPLLEGSPDAQPITSISGAQISSRWAQHRSVVQEAALSACLEVYEAVAPQVVNMHLVQIVQIVAASIFRGSSDASSQSTLASDRAAMLESFLIRIVERIGKSNSAVTLLEALWTVTQRQTSLPAIDALLRRPPIATAIGAAVEECIDTERVLNYVSTLCDHVATSSEALDHESQSLAAATLRLLAVVVDGVQPTSLTSSMIAEKVAEVDLLISTCLLSPASSEGTSHLVTNGVATLLSLRRLMDRCISDLGVTSLDSYLRVLEESLWQFGSNAAGIVGDLTLEQLRNVVTDESLLCAFVLQRVALSHAVTTCLGITPQPKGSVKQLAGFVVNCLSAKSSSEAGLLELSLREFVALAAYGRKMLTASLVRILRERCALSATPPPNLLNREWTSAAGAVFDAVAVVLMESTLTSPELPAVIGVLRCLATDRGTVPRLPQVLQSLVALLLTSDEDEGGCPCPANHAQVVDSVASLTLLILQVSEEAPQVAFFGSAAVYHNVKPRFALFMEEDNEDLLSERRAAADALRTTLLSKRMVRFLVTAASMGGEYRACASLLRHTFELATSYASRLSAVDEASASLIQTFITQVVKALTVHLKSRQVEALRCFLAAVPTSHSAAHVHVPRARGAPKKRDREDDEHTKAVPTHSHFEPMIELLLELWLKGDASQGQSQSSITFCLATLLLTHREAASTVSRVVDREALLSQCQNGDLLQSWNGTLVSAIALFHDRDDAASGKADEPSLWLRLVEAKLLPGSGNSDERIWTELCRALPLAIAAFPSLNVLQSVTHVVLRRLCERGTTLHAEVIPCLAGLSRVSSPSFKFSTMKRYVRTALMSTVEACVSLGDNSAAGAKVFLAALQQLLLLLRLPLQQYHGDQEFVDLELQLMQLLPEKLNAIVPLTQKSSSIVVTSQLTAVVVQSLVLLSGTFLDLHVFRRRTHLLAPLISAWFLHVLHGLDANVYGGPITSAFSALLFRVSRALSRSLDLSSHSQSANGTDAQSTFGVSASELLLHETAITSAMFRLAARHVGVFARYAAELDFVATDLIKVLHRERLPDVFANVKNEGDRRSLSMNSFADLAFAAIGSDEGKNLLKQAILFAMDSATGEDNSILFSAKERLAR